MALWAVLYAALILRSIVDAVPTIAFPLNSQVPPVARISEPFSYTFSNSTFSSTLPLLYTLSNAPSWLSLDSSSRTLSGTPTANDVGTNAVTGFNIGLTASDQSGSVTLNATLVVSTNSAPIVVIPLSAQLANFGMSSLPSTILYRPSTNFQFNFEAGTFSDEGSSSGLSYYSVTLGNTPLPSWIQFDGSSLSFSGRTPDYQSLIQPPQTFGIQLAASDVEGFSGVSIPFEIEVGVHLLDFKNADLVVNATVGADINFDGLQNNLELDGAVASLSSLTSITVQTPPWLSFDNSTFLLRGTVPADAVPANVTVQATDIYGDTDSATVLVDITTAATSMFVSSIGSLNVTIGSPFSFDFSSYVRNRSDVDLTAQFSPMTSWIQFDSKTFIMSGTVPPTLANSKVTVTLTATSESSHASSTQTFAFFLTPGTGLPSISSSTAPHSPTSTDTQSTSSYASISSSSNSRKRLTKGGIAAIAVVIPLLALVIILALCYYLARRRAAKKRPKSPAKSKISVPMEVESSVVEIVRPTITRVIPPEPLQLDTSGFTTEQSSSTFIKERKRRSTRLADNPLRRSQTMSAVSGERKADWRQSSGMRERSYSDNALSRTDRSWRSTQDSAYPTISSNSGTNSSHRLTRNYSRKGQKYDSGKIKFRDSVLGESSILMKRPQSTILNLGDSNFSCTPLDNFSALSKQNSTQNQSEFGDSLQDSKSVNRKSRFIPGIDQRSGVGHGRRESISTLAGLPATRRSAGHGQNWESVGVPRDSRTWLTVNLTVQEHDRLNVSGIAENINDLDMDRVAPLSIRAIPNTHIPPSSAYLSDGNASTRPVSRRAVGSSPFFAGGGSMKSSRKSPSKVRTSYADSPTVPTETMMGSNVIGFVPNESITARDSFGISYGAAREGTRQLRSFLQSKLNRSKTSGTMRSNESTKSRFESADSLDQSQPNIIIHTRSPDIDGAEAREEGEAEYEDNLPDDYSEGSWESHRTRPRDSLGNIIEYGLGESPKVATAATQRHTLAPATALRSHPTSPMPPDIGPGARMVSGKGKRPLSINAAANQGSVRVIVESDYTAFV